jgi:hypothetical protein
MSAGLPSKVSVPEDVVWQMVGGEVVLFAVTAERFYGLDPVGSQMWEVLQEHPAPAEACERLCAMFDVEEETLRGDLAGLIARLADAGMLHVDD